MITSTLRFQLLERRSTHPEIECPSCKVKAPLVGGIMETHLPAPQGGGWSCHFVYRCQMPDCNKGWITSDTGKIHGFQALTMHEL